jgi:hypothetical protein
VVRQEPVVTGSVVPVTKAMEILHTVVMVTRPSEATTAGDRVIKVGGVAITTRCLNCRRNAEATSVDGGTDDT